MEEQQLYMYIALVASLTFSDSAGLGRSQVGGGFHYEPPCDFKGHPSKVMLRTEGAGVTHPAAPRTQHLITPTFPFIHFDVIPYTSVELSPMGRLAGNKELNENQGLLSTDHPSMVVVHLWVGGSLWPKASWINFQLWWRGSSIAPGGAGATIVR